MNSTGRSSSHGVKKRGIHEAEPHNHDEDDNKIVKKKKVFDGDDEELVSIQVGVSDAWRQLLRLGSAYRNKEADALGMDNKPILGKNGKPVKVKATVTTTMLLTQSSMVVAAGSAHATQYLAKNAIDGSINASTAGLLALPVINDIINVLAVDTTGSLIQHGSTEPLQFLINLVVGDQYKDYYSSIYQTDKHTYCTNSRKDQLKGAIIFSVQGNEMINFLSPSVQLIGKVVGNVFKDFFVNLIKKLEGIDMMKGFAAVLLTGLYDMLGKFFAGNSPSIKVIKVALNTFAQIYIPQFYLYAYSKVVEPFKVAVVAAVETFQALQRNGFAILNKFIQMMETATKKATDLQQDQHLIAKKVGAIGGYTQTASKPTDAYVNEAEQKVSKNISFVEIDPELAIELSKEATRDEAIGESQSEVIGKSKMLVHLAKYVFGGVEIDWVDPSKLTHLNPKEVAYLALKNAWLFKHFGGHDELREQLRKEGSNIVPA